MEEKKEFCDCDQLPAHYGLSYVGLLPRDPCCVYAYWELSEQSIQQAGEALGDRFEGAVRCLRMHEVSASAPDGPEEGPWFDVELGLDSDNRYVDLQGGNASYRAEVGYRAGDGEFVSLASSNRIHTPVDASSKIPEPQWVKVPPKVQPAKPKSEKAAPPPLPPPQGRQRKIRSITEEDVRAYYSSIFPLLKHAYASRIAPRKKTAQRKKDTPETSVSLPLPVFRIPAEFLTCGSSESRPMPGSSENVFGGASDQFNVPKGFFFEIGTELIVYGRTEPGARVLLAGNPVSLHEDGTFSLRFSLPEGIQALPFRAQSADGSQIRSLSTAVERKKTETTND